MLASGTLTIDGLIATHAWLRPEQPAVLSATGSGTTSTTYRQLESVTADFATRLRELDIGAGDVIGVMLPNGMPFCTALLGTTRAGAIAMPIPTSSSTAELEHVLAHSRCRALVGDARARPMLDAALAAVARSSDEAAMPWLQSGEDAAAEWTVSRIGTGRHVAGRSVAAAAGVAPHLAPAVLMYTSGSTARPKGIVLSHQAVISAGLCNAWHQGLGPQDRQGIVLPMYHSNAMFLQFWAAMASGGSVYFGRKFDPATYWREMNAARVTVGDLVSAGIRALLAAEDANRAESMRFMMYGLPMRDDELAAFERRFGCPLSMVYGLTETAACGTRSPIHLERRQDRIGLPMPGWEVRVLDGAGRDCEPGEDGEVWLKGPSMFSGYLHDDAATRQVMHEGGLMTGDVGHFDAGGYLVFVDRRKDLIKVKGRSVASLEVEAVLRDHPAVADVAVLGVPDVQTDERIVAFVVCAAPVSPEELVAHCATRLSRYKVPAEFVFRDALPKTAVGKVRKSELKAEIVAHGVGS